MTKDCAGSGRPSGQQRVAAESAEIDSQVTPKLCYEYEIKMLGTLQSLLKVLKDSNQEGPMA